MEILIQKYQNKVVSLGKEKERCSSIIALATIESEIKVWNEVISDLECAMVKATNENSGLHLQNVNNHVCPKCGKHDIHEINLNYQCLDCNHWWC